MNEVNNTFSNEEEKIIANTIHNKMEKSYERSLWKHFLIQSIIIIIGCISLSFSNFIIFTSIVIIIDTFIPRCIYRIIIYNAYTLVQEVCNKREEDPSVSIEILLEYINNSKQL